MAIDPDKLNEFLGRGVIDFGAVFHAAAVLIGDKLPVSYDATYLNAAKGK